jgi:hypothetical protein
MYLKSFKYKKNSGIRIMYIDRSLIQIYGVFSLKCSSINLKTFYIENFFQSVMFVVVWLMRRLYGESVITNPVNSN